MEGGCFTVSNLGGISGSFFTPIINPPEVAILGVSPIKIKPLWKSGGVHTETSFAYHTIL